MTAASLSETPISSIGGDPKPVPRVAGRAERNDPVLRGAGIMHGLGEDAVDALIADMDTMHLDSGSVIFRQGDPGDHLYIVLSGKVKLARRFDRGLERLVALLGPGDQFGELSLFDPGLRNSTATVVAEAHFARLDKASLERWILQRPDIALRILHVLARRLRRTSSDLADTIFIDVPGRVAKQLLLLARQFGARNGEGIQVVHDLRQAEIAQLVGASRETVNKALSDFADRGWLRVDKGSAVILDPERLARRAR